MLLLYRANIVVGYLVSVKQGKDRHFAQLKWLWQPKRMECLIVMLVLGEKLNKKEIEDPQECCTLACLSLFKKCKISIEMRHYSNHCIDQVMKFLNKIF